MIDKGPVLLDIADGIARMRLNRPDAANGMSAELLSALCNAIMVCHGQADLRVLLLSVWSMRTVTWSVFTADWPASNTLTALTVIVETSPASRVPGTEPTATKR